MKKLIDLLMQQARGLFSFGEDAAREEEVIEGVWQGIAFRGAKLWILILALFVASLGLNTNSAAVIIGAMLISPLSATDKSRLTQWMKRRTNTPNLRLIFERVGE